MKTLLLCPEMFSSEGGIARILRLYLKALSELSGQGDTVDILLLNDPVLDSGDRRRYSDEHLGEWMVCSKRKPLFIRNGVRLGRRADRAVCGHIAQLPVAWFASRLRRGPPMPYYLVAHGIEVWRPLGLLERIAVRGARNVWCVSEYTRRELLRRCPLPEGRAVVLANALDPYFTPAPSAADPAVRPMEMLCVTRLSRGDAYKGVDHLISALPLVLASNPSARLRIVGTGDDLPRLQGLARKSGVPGSVTFSGFESDEDLRRSYARCGAFALPSEKEGFGLVYLEAMANGKPCLAARSAGAPEVVDESCGRLVAYGDVPALAAAWLEILSLQWDAAAIRRRTQRLFGYEAFKGRVAAALAP